jgi:hypothetical protein
MPRTQFNMVADVVGVPPRDALTRDLDQSNTAYTALKLPAPLYYQPNNKGHTDGRLVGRIDTITIRAGQVDAAGEMFDADEDMDDMPMIVADAREAIRVGTEGMVAPSVDPTILAVEPNADGRPALTRADISGVTLVGMPAMTGTSITFTRPEAAVVPTPSEVEYMVGEDDVEGSLAGLVAAADAEGEVRFAALVAAVNEPAPAAAFAKPDTSRYRPGFTVEGRRISGHLAAIDACHLGWAETCVTPPPSPSGYALFTRYTLATDAGDLAVGRVTTGLGKIGSGCTCCDLDDHACPNRMGLVAAMAHHDQMPKLADVVIGEDDGVIWVSGLLKANLSTEEQQVLSRRVWSGDWRPAGEADELIEILALHHREPGFSQRVKTTRTRGVLIAAVGPSEPEPALGDMVARAVRGYAALTDLTTALDDAAQANAAAALTTLER